MLRLLKIAAAMCVAGLALLASVPAVAHGHWRGGGYHDDPRVGVYFGGPIFSPFYYSARRCGYPPAAPTVYVERGDVQAAAPTALQAVPPAANSSPRPESYWYYCPDSIAYYPHVMDCPSPWQRVSPQPFSTSQ